MTESAHPAASGVQLSRTSHELAEHLGKPPAVHDVAYFKGSGSTPSHMTGTMGSSPLMWESKTVNRGAGHIAGYGKSNRGTLFETEF